MDTAVFVYEDAKGNITIRAVNAVSETDHHLQGLCPESGRIRTFRRDRILGFIENEEQLDAVEALLEAYESEPLEAVATGTMDVCFTGFKKDDKSELVKLADESGLQVRQSVTRNLDILCCGYNAGPKKVEKARHQGVLIVDRGQLEALLETGEVPEMAE